MKRPWDAIQWWEVRRIPFNLVLAALGLVTVLVIEVVGSTLAKPSEDAVEPALLFVGVVLYGIGANMAYTLGWITELLWSAGDTNKAEVLRARVFLIGLLGSSIVTVFPAVLASVIWAGVRLTHR
jgi:hypothetical protein